MTAPPTGLRVLVVGDEPALRDTLARGLKKEGWHVDTAPTGQAGLKAVRRAQPDLVLVDIADTEGRGLEFLARARKRHATPIAILVDRTEALGLLLDPPASRPGDIEQHGPQGEKPADRLAFAGLLVDRASREVFVEGVLIDTTAREFDLLAFLAASPRRVFTRAQLLEKVWGSAMGWQRPTTVTEHVRRLRGKIEADPQHPRWVVTVRGVGYRFEPG